MARKLTPKSGRVLVKLNAFYELHKIMPTREELAIIAGYSSPNSIQLHFTALEKNGYIKLIPSISRGIVITSTGKKICTHKALKTHLKALYDN